MSVRADALDAPVARERTQLGLAWLRFRQHRLALAGLVVITILAIGALFASQIAPYDPDEPDVRVRRQPPSLAHPMGTDQLGRDQLSRLLHGGRFSLQVGLMATIVAVSVGTLVGAMAGHYGGALDNLLMRIVDLMFTLPRLLVLLLLGAVFKASLLFIIVLLGLTSWMTVARLVRASFLSLREKEFVEAARAVGVRDRRLIWRHMLPNAAGPIIVAATLGVAGTILVESTLSYLGYGVQPPTPTWGNMLQNAQGELYTAPWLTIFPGLFIFLTIMAINFVGDGLRDALDPRTISRR
jgi:peptide/nickel transport system permease protein